MEVTYDPEVDAAYIYLVPISRGSVHETVCVADEASELAGDVNLDLDKEGRLLGIEILGARRFLPPELLR
jgi:uncharacterized protein YuzE